jgi:hypothetical protein
MPLASELGSLAGSDSEVLVAGPSIDAEGSWTPIAFGDQIGWVRTEYTVDNTSCPSMRPPSSVGSCEDVANATVTMFAEIATTVAEIEPADGVGAAGSGTYDSLAETLVADASSRSCAASDLNAMITVGRNQIPVQGEFAALVVEVLYADDFYSDR